VIWDHNRNHLFQRAKAVYDDPEAAKYVWGAGFHWYEGDNFENMELTHEVWPEKHLIFTEGCQEGGTHDGSWALGERYGRSMINDFNRWTTAWLDWNLLLDEKGGPNHVHNLCSAPILVDTQTGELIYQNSYFYIGHFSRFITPGSRRLAISSSHDHFSTPSRGDCLDSRHGQSPPPPDELQAFVVGFESYNSKSSFDEQLGYTFVPSSPIILTHLGPWKEIESASTSKLLLADLVHLGRWRYGPRVDHALLSW
jgi:hypothetical protein